MPPISILVLAASCCCRIIPEARIRLKSDGNMLILIGREEGHLGQSIYQNFATGKFDGAPPPVDLESEIKAGRLIRTLIREGRVAAVHDCADGGLLVAIAEMALAGGKHGLSRESSGLGVELYPYEGKLPAHAIWFGEDQGRYVVEVTPQKAEEVLERARLLELPARIIGRTGGDAIGLKGETALPLSELRAAHEAWMPKLMARKARKLLSGGVQRWRGGAFERLKSRLAGKLVETGKPLGLRGNRRTVADFRRPNRLIAIGKQNQADRRHTGDQRHEQQSGRAKLLRGNAGPWYVRPF